MKKFYLCFTSFLLAGCAAGINHNVAQIGGQTYLVQTVNRNALGLAQWSEPSVLIPLENTPGAQYCPAVIDTKAYVAKIAAECNANTASPRANYKKMYKCIIEKLTDAH